MGDFLIELYSWWAIKYDLNTWSDVWLSKNL